MLLFSSLSSLFHTRIDEFAELSHAPISRARSTNIFERTVIGNQRTLGIEIIRVQIPTTTTTTTTKRRRKKTQDEAVVVAPINP